MRADLKNLAETVLEALEGAPKAAFLDLLSRVGEHSAAGFPLASADIHEMGGPAGAIPEGLSPVKADVEMSDVLLPAETKSIIGDFIDEQENSALYVRNGLQPRNKMLLMGPPGNGKTVLCRAIAKRLDCPIYMVRYDELISSVQGETSQRLHALFEYAKQGRCILFFDEMDAIGGERSDEGEAREMKRVVSTLLVQMDDVPAHVIVLAASNHAGMLDRAVLRRFHSRVTLPTPDLAAYVEYIGRRFARYGHRPKMDLEVLAIALEPENFADVEVFCDDAVRVYVRSAGALTIEKSINKARIDWPRSRAKVHA